MFVGLAILGVPSGPKRIAPAADRLADAVGGGRWFVRPRNLCPNGLPELSGTGGGVIDRGKCDRERTGRIIGSGIGGADFAAHVIVSGAR
jgi:hypothetical protein